MLGLNNLSLYQDFFCQVLVIECYLLDEFVWEFGLIVIGMHFLVIYVILGGVLVYYINSQI